MSGLLGKVREEDRDCVDFLQRILRSCEILATLHDSRIVQGQPKLLSAVCSLGLFVVPCLDVAVTKCVLQGSSSAAFEPWLRIRAPATELQLHLSWTSDMVWVRNAPLSSDGPCSLN